MCHPEAYLTRREIAGKGPEEMRRRSIAAGIALAVVASLSVGLPSQGVAAIQKPDGGAPIDYAKQLPKLSQPKYKTVEEYFNVEMKDGETMYVEVTRPKTDKPVPTVLELSPYHGTLADREGFRIFPGPRDKEGNMIGLTGYFAPRGYAVVMADLRGTGKSSGCLDHMGPLDQQDSKDPAHLDRTSRSGRTAASG